MPIDSATAPRHGCLYRLVRAAAICLGLTALAALSGYVAMLWMLEEDKVEAPRVVGVESVAAEALIREVGLLPRIVAEEFSAAIPKGHVTNQRPSRGTRVKIGGEVRLMISRGSDQLEAPNLAGLAPAQAQRSLAEAGLVLGPVTAIHSDAHRRETIIAQDPPAGSTVTRGATVRLLQSLGPLDDIVVVPDLYGREMVVAVNLLRELQLEARLAFQEAVTGDGYVVAQDPPAGTQVKVGGQVQITVGE
jgi:eukaryotic-like serine/threonine-protein kinase